MSSFAIKKVLFVFFMITICLLSACAGDNGGTNAQSTQSDETSAALDAEVYVYPEIDYGGGTVDILNMDAYWGMYVTISPDAITGEALNDAVYERNKTVEEQFGCQIVDAKIASNNIFDAVVDIGRKAVLAGEDAYDVMYLPMSRITSLLTDGGFYNLYDLPAIRLEESWWDGAFNGAAAVGNNLYFAAGDLHLMAYDSTWCIFFNENIINDNGLPLPYDKVRAGKWTIDELIAYCASTADLNDGSSFAWDEGSSTVYGLSAHPHAPDKFVLSAGEKYVRKDTDGAPYFAADNERYYDVTEKLAKLLTAEGGSAIEASYDDFNASEGGYMYIFANRRSAFLTAEIKAAQLLRDMHDNFGILPFPKFDENQEDYRSALMSDLLVMTIPVTNTAASDTAAVMDALCYESSRQVVGVYFDITVSQKGLRNDDSIEMMQIMRYNRDADLSAIYNWNEQLVNVVRTDVFAGEGAQVSEVTKHIPAIMADIDDFMEAFDMQS